MCQPATCTTCGKTTWTGCGRHVDDVMRTVPANRRCPGHEDVRPSGFLARLFGR
ncbi:hypothetical protein [Isoptericola cucumis]|uniref:Uncharacterized protein n=1 Tax=Isoptericola cucumis TaxID=1776856 RepID=A0ABQ2BC89_9MICO|nr:hypothetical protein [Isoptericola cucumis]GGI11245.1 hypothetical protein GCM10007368_35240 [Isoptericola cucumis]